MQLLEWKDAWSMGEARLDGQHQAMVDALNRLVEAVAAGRPGPEVEPLMAMLSVYVETHMRHEEALMARINYPGAASHRLKHGVFARRIDALVAAHAAQGTAVLPDLVTYMKDWLGEHLEGDDQALAAFLKT